MQIENSHVLCHDASEAGSQISVFGQEGFHLVSCHIDADNGYWQLTFSNWVTVLAATMQKGSS